MDNWTEIATSKTEVAIKKTDPDPRCKFRETIFKIGKTGTESSERVKTINQPMAYRKLSLPRFAKREIITIATDVITNINIE